MAGMGWPMCWRLLRIVLERAGLNRTVAALSIVGLVILSDRSGAAHPSSGCAAEPCCCFLQGSELRRADLRAYRRPDRPWSSWLQSEDSSKALSDFMRYAST